MSFTYSNGAQFNGSSQYFTHTVISAATTNFSVVMWVKPVAFSSSRPFCNGADDGNGFAFNISNTGLFQGEYNFIAFISSGVTLKLGLWYQLAMINNGGTTQMYVNAVAQGSTSSSTPNGSSGFTTIGCSKTNGGTASAFSNSVIDEVRLYERAITVPELIQLYNRAFDVSTPDISSTSLKAWYKLDESSGDAADSSGGGFTMTNTGTVVYVTGHIPSAQYTSSSIVRNTTRPRPFAPGIAR